MKHGRYYLCYFICLLLSACANDNLELDRPVVNFSYSSSTDFKAPTTVQFTNATTFSTAQSWDLGNGQLSEVENPSATYILPGTYTVTLSARSERGNINSLSQEIVINKVVAGNFKSLYFTDATKQKVYRVVLDGTTPQLAELPSFSVTPTDIIVDETEQKIYYTDGSSQGKVYRSDFDGQNLETILDVSNNTAINWPQGIALINNQLFWSRFSQGIYQADLDATNLTVFDPTAASFPSDLAVDSDANFVYWSTENGGIYRKGLDSENSELIIPNVKTAAIAIDASNQKIYFGDDRGTGQTGIYRADLTGENMEKIADDVRYLRGIALDVEAGKIYWSNRDRGDAVGDSNSSIVRANLDGSEAEDWITGIYPYAIAIDQVKR